MSRNIDFACGVLARENSAQRFLSGKLNAQEVETFESHLLTCDRCQQDVVLGAAVRKALNAQSAVRSARYGSTTSVRRWYAAAVVTIAAAAAFVALVRVPRGDGDDSVARLGGIAAAPVYLGVPVRAGDDDRQAAERFEKAMQAYSAGEYEKTVRILDELLTNGQHTPPSEFFRASSLLMLDRNDESITAFDRVVAFGDTPYLGEALYYRAKARLREGDAPGALTDLQGASDGPSIVSQQARALRDSVSLATRGESR